jgi:phosphoserine phosphatase
MGFTLVVFDLDGVLVEEASAWWTLHHAFGTYEASKENLYAKWEGQVYFVGICIFARSFRERRDIIKGCVLLLCPRLREGMLRK